VTIKTFGCGNTVLVVFSFKDAVLFRFRLTERGLREFSAQLEQAALEAPQFPRHI
jgi:hypothetical protein